jgi:hypothetical protein
MHRGKWHATRPLVGAAEQRDRNGDAEPFAGDRLLALRRRWRGVSRAALSLLFASLQCLRAVINQVFDEVQSQRMPTPHVGYNGHAAQRSGTRADAKASVSCLGRNIPRSVPVGSLRAPNRAPNGSDACSAAEGLGALSHLVRAGRRTMGSQGYRLGPSCLRITPAYRGGVSYVSRPTLLRQCNSLQ